MSTASNDSYLDDEVSLTRYLFVVWRHRLTLIAVVLTTGLAAFVVNWFREPTFEATAKLMVSPSKIGEVAGQAVSVATFVSLVDNQTLVLDTLNELELTKPPRSLRLDQVQRDRLRVAAIRDANVIEVHALFWDPALAAKVANRLAERSVQLARRLAQEDTVSARDTIKVQLDQSEQRLAEAERRLEEFKRKAQVDLLSKDTDALLEQQGTLVPLMVQIEGDRARIARFTEELAKQEPVRAARRSVDPAGKDYNFRGELLDPYVNPVHEMLQQELSTALADLASLEKEHAEAMRVVGSNQAGVAKLSELYAKQAELGRLQTEAGLAKKIYEAVSTRYEDARLQVAGRTPQLQVIDLAVPPAERVGPRVLRNTVLAMALSLLIASGLVLLATAVTGEVTALRSTRP
jgi:uncharacterized protein involved in exopolysaccharide biosynthesis